jgi:hypothetical protein
MSSLKLSPFDIVNIIYLKERELTDEEIDLWYNAYIINRALSNNLDTIFLANELNMSWQLSKRMQFHFFYYAVDKRKRYGKWHKKEVDAEEEKIQLIKDCYGYSTTKARETLPLIEQQKGWGQLKAEMKKGGIARSK